jgi:hypothetical protein
MVVKLWSFLNMNSLPDDPSFDRRLTVLETRFDIILPTLATKSDIERLRTELGIGHEKFGGELGEQLDNFRSDIRKGLRDYLKVTVRLMVILFIEALSVSYIMLNATLDAVVSQQSHPTDRRPDTAVPETKQRMC